jgi:hypothetical protein
MSPAEPLSTRANAPEEDSGTRGEAAYGQGRSVTGLLYTNRQERSRNGGYWSVTSISA